MTNNNNDNKNNNNNNNYTTTTTTTIFFAIFKVTLQKRFLEFEKGAGQSLTRRTAEASLTVFTAKKVGKGTKTPYFNVL